MKQTTEADKAQCAMLHNTAEQLMDIAAVILATGECSADEWEYARRVLSHALALLEIPQPKPAAM
jgi:hypothetical protein